MKQLKSLFALIGLSVVLVGFSSCTEDEEIANTLYGTWTGSISTIYQDRYGLTGEDYRTTIQFNTDGTGYEVDYNVNSPRANYAYSTFTWSVYNGVITLRYADQGWAPTYISSYTLNNSTFSGSMDDGTNRGINFTLYYDGNFNWSNYDFNQLMSRSNSETSHQITLKETYGAAGEFKK